MTVTVTVVRYHPTNENKGYKMTNIELLDIHLNNSDLTLGNLAQIHNSTIATVRAILSEYYAGKSWTSPILAQPDSETGGSLGTKPICRLRLRNCKTAQNPTLLGWLKTAISPTGAKRGMH